MKLYPDEAGLLISTEKWYCIRETDCFYHCVPEHNKLLSVDLAKKHNLLKRIAKTNSRFAFDTKEKALEHLRFMKRRQLIHLNRDIAFIERFLSQSEFERYGTCMRVNDSSELVGKHFRFD